MHELEDTSGAWGSVQKYMYCRYVKVYNFSDHTMIWYEHITVNYIHAFKINVFSYCNLMIFSSCYDLLMQQITTIWTISAGAHPGTIPVEFSQIS